MAELRIELLRPLRAVYGGRELVLGPARQQALVAVLAFHPGQELTPDELLEATWGPDAPASGVRVVAPYIYRIRKLLPCPSLVRRGRRGYALQLDRSNLDVTQLTETIELARASVAGGDHRAAVGRFSEAISQFDGQPMAGLPGHWVAATRRRFEELRRTVIAEQAGVLLGLGQYEQPIADLTSLLDRDPLDEGLARQLMLAHYHAGHQTEALNIYRRTSRALRDEFGLEPTPALRATLVDILNHTCSSLTDRCG
jgi:DNA-binding SARP family transcriptional activator